MQGQVYNVGSEVLNHSKRDICDMIQKKTGAYFHYAEVGSDGDKRNYSVSYEKIKRLGYETTISVEQGIDELVKAMPAIKILNPYANV
jgi:nucleoside-diphosphate-sugar epimerase